MVNAHIYILYILVLVLARIPLYGQQESDPNHLDQQLNDEATHITLSQELREEKNDQQSKLSIHQISETALDRFEFLNQKDKVLILDYIKKHSPLISSLELQSIRDIELEKINQLIPYLDDKVNIKSASGSKFRWQDLKGRISQRWSRNFPHSDKIDLADSISSSYVGNADRLFFRVNLAQAGLYSAGFVTEKDEGERLWDPSSKTGVDYLSAHLFLNNPHPKLRSVAIGDYRMRIGQGIILDNSFIGASLTDPGFLVKSTELLKPYQSLQENNMLRGLAMQFVPTSHSIMNIFYSKSRIDANVHSDLGDQPDDQRISSILQSGYHRTAAELQDRNALGIQYTGIDFKQRFGASYMGMSVVNSYQDLPIVNDPTPYKALNNEAQNQWYSSIYHQFPFKGALLFGELASDKSYNLATIQGILKGLGKYADVAILYRNFSPSFNSRMSQVFSASGKSQNEKGLSSYFNFYITKEIRLNLRWDTWQNPWLRYRIDNPTESREFSTRISYIKKRKWTGYLQFSVRNRNQNSQAAIENKLVPVEDINLRFHVDIKIHPDWTWRARAEFHHSAIDSEGENGYLIFQDFIYKGVESPVSGNFRISHYKTDGYNSRIYAFENDMLYQFSIPAFFGSGTSAYLNLRSRINHHWMMEMRFAITYNGYNSDLEIDAAHYNKELKLQLHYSF